MKLIDQAANELKKAEPKNDWGSETVGQ